VKIRCPICHAELEVENNFATRPFCSPRCKKLDLKNWLEGAYRLPRELLPEELEQLPPEKREEVLREALGDALKRELN
jgi:endogenous inhibitor of DNA gyrase (YacG/DUF329 family)